MALKRTTLVVVALAAFPSPALAADARDAKGEGIETMVVSASRYAQRLLDVPVSMSVVDAEAMATQGVRFVGDELLTVPGLSISQADEGTYTGITVRGVRNEHQNDTFVAMVDGVPFVTIDDEVDLEQVPFVAVERVEVLRGPTSALYGRGGVAGAINYITRTPGEAMAGELDVGLGDDGYRRVQGWLDLPLDGASTSLLLAGTADRGDGWRDDTARDSMNLFAKARHAFSDALVLGLTAQYLDQRQDVAGELPADAQGNPIRLPGGARANYNVDGANYDKKLWALGLSIDARLADSLRSSTRLHYRDQDTESVVGFYNGFDAESRLIDFTGFNGYKDGDTTYVEQQFTWQSGAHSLIAGGSYERIDAFSGERWTGEFGFDEATFDFYFYQQRRNVDTREHVNRDAWQSAILLDANAKADVHGLYLQYELQATDALRLLVAARRDGFEREVVYRGEERIEKRIDDSHVSPKASVTWQFLPEVLAYVSYGEGFSPAFGPVWSFNGRPDDLDPEISRNIELGLKGRIADGQLTFALAGYELTRKDLRRRIAVGGGQFRDVNVGEARSRGLELETQFALDALVDGLGGYANYTWVDAEWVDNTFVNDFTEQRFDFSGQTVARVPEQSASLGLTQQLPAQGLTASAWLNYVGDYWFDDANTAEGGSYVVWNANVARPRCRP